MENIEVVEKKEVVVRALGVLVVVGKTDRVKYEVVLIVVVVR